MLIFRPIKEIAFAFMVPPADSKQNYGKHEFIR
jgi:hypothetical protein